MSRIAASAGTSVAPSRFSSPNPDRSDPRLDSLLRSRPMPNGALTIIGKQVLGKHGDKAAGRRLRRRHQHASSPVAGDLHRRLKDRARRVEGGGRGIVCHRRIAPLELLAGFEHPPRYAGFSSRHHPIPPHSSCRAAEARLPPGHHPAQPRPGPTRRFDPSTGSGRSSGRATAGRKAARSAITRLS